MGKPPRHLYRFTMEGMQFAREQSPLSAARSLRRTVLKVDWDAFLWALGGVTTISRPCALEMKRESIQTIGRNRR